MPALYGPSHCHQFLLLRKHIWLPLQVKGYRIVPTIHLCTIFVVSGLTLDTKEAIEAVKAPKGLLYGLVSILGITPLLGFVMLEIPFDEKAFKTGLAIFCTVPTTLSSGVALVTSVRVLTLWETVEGKCA
jgi:predicted Na+-dependent transporter